MFPRTSETGARRADTSVHSRRGDGLSAPLTAAGHTAFSHHSPPPGAPPFHTPWSGTGIGRFPIAAAMISGKASGVQAKAGAPSAASAAACAWS